MKPEVPDPMDIESRCCGRPRAAEEAAGLGVGVWRPRRTRFGAGGQRAWRGRVVQGLERVVRHPSVNREMGAEGEGCWGH